MIWHDRAEREPPFPPVRIGTTSSAQL